ncbi:MAG: CDP-alcohol phosphatidyltransferase family protein [Victivallales bacterium]|nr:CDP-alcohol phosphatidyltransferase family protein [Victivallales bacterium]
MKKYYYRNLLANNKWLKKLPNFLTICNSLCGFAAILYTLHVYDNNGGSTAALTVSAWIILFAMVFDATDGFAARIFNAASMKGLQMDSLSDMVTFGVAPAVMVAVMAHRMKVTDTLFTTNDYIMIWGITGIYIGCAALRLAAYNVNAIWPSGNHDSNYFTGLPSPGAAAAVASMIIYINNTSGNIRHLTYILPLYAAMLGFLMISNIRYVHAGRWLQTVKRNRRRLLLLFLIVITIAVWREKGVIVWINIYIVSGPLAALLRRTGIMKKKAPATGH